METTAKKIVQRNLSLSDKYTLSAIRHGSVIDGDGTVCDNCNAMISNVATITNEAGKAFHVGMDCMKTLTLKPSLATEELLESYKDFTAFLGKCNKPDATMQKDASMVFVQWIAPNGRKQYGSGFVHQVNEFMGMDAFMAQYGHKF
jgi:hypothetical protein